MNKKVFIFVPLFLVFVFLFTIIAPINAISADVSQKVFRLHILANSDSFEDQELKLNIRNKVLRISEQIYAECNSVEDAINATNSNIDYLKKEIQKTIAFNGFDYDINLFVTKEYYSTRQYNGFTLPAGVYNGLRIVIGKGLGHNWWCVMYPSVCLSGAIKDFERELTKEQIDAITDKKYILGFKSVEIYQYIKCQLYKNKT